MSKKTPDPQPKNSPERGRGTPSEAEKQRRVAKESKPKTDPGRGKRGGGGTP